MAPRLPILRRWRVGLCASTLALGVPLGGHVAHATTSLKSPAPSAVNVNQSASPTLARQPRLERGAPAPKGWKPPTRESVDTTLQAAHDLSLERRLIVATEAFVGAPYAVSPLGEGSGKDPDPRIRFDQFYCTTFVETAMALALSRDLPSAEKTLDVIRYRGGVPNFEGRRHFPEAEWIPELKAQGFLEDVTKRIGGDEVGVESKRLDAKVWDRRSRPSHL